ncbi:hypothetical protein GGGNBK_22720 [Sporosarcina sp. ANT_H38]
MCGQKYGRLSAIYARCSNLSKTKKACPKENRAARMIAEVIRKYNVTLLQPDLLIRLLRLLCATVLSVHDGVVHCE